MERQGPVAVWTIARPEAKNALDFRTMTDLQSAIQGALQDRELRAVVLTGAGDTFVSGGDLRELRTATTPSDAERLTDMGRWICEGLAALHVPVVAALNGHAIGGGAELAIACDLRIADDRAKICFKQVRMGVTTAWGVFPKLLSLVGPASAARLIYTAHEVRAMEARALGLVDQVTDNGSAVATAIAWCLDIAQGSPRAIADMKQLFRFAQYQMEPVRIRERQLFVSSWLGPDHEEAMNAFFSSRAPNWRR